MVWELMAQAPLLWDLLGTLLTADPLHERQCTQVQVSLTSTQHCKGSNLPANVIPDNGPDWDDEDEYWAQIDDNILLQNSPEPNKIMDGSKRQHRAAQSHSTLIQIVCILHMFTLDQ